MFLFLHSVLSVSLSIIHNSHLKKKVLSDSFTFVTFWKDDVRAGDAVFMHPHTHSVTVWQREWIPRLSVQHACKMCICGAFLYDHCMCLCRVGCWFVCAAFTTASFLPPLRLWLFWRKPDSLNHAEEPETDVNYLSFAFCCSAAKAAPTTLFCIWLPSITIQQ